MTDSEEEGVMLINDLKMKWFTLLSRVDASPTVDETVLTSLNSIANMLISNRKLTLENDVLFAFALRMGIFESIFRWNFVFCGADLEAFKAKELQFYDTLLTGDGKQYLRFPEFALPLLATLHHCAIRSSLPVERVLVRTLNSVCAAMCAQFSDHVIAEPSHNELNNGCDYPITGLELVEDLSFFKRLSMGLVSDCRYMGSKFGQSVDSTQNTLDITGSSSAIKVADAVDWPLSIESKTPYSTDIAFSSLERSFSCTSHDSASNIDSIFDLLIPFVFREGDLGWQARDAFLLVATYSNKDEDFSYNLAQYTSVCPVLATGLATLYAELPRELVSNNYPQSWPELVQTLEEHDQTCTQFIEFFGALEFCESVLEVAHPLIQSSLLQYIHSGFFVSVLGFSLTKPNVQEVITATIFLKEIVMRTTNSAILPALLRFLLTAMPEEKPSAINGNVVNEIDQSDSDTEIRSTLSDPTNRQNISRRQSTVSSASGLTYMDLLISRLHYCNTLLGVATLSLFNTLINLNCEDIMFYLVLRHLVPFRDALFDLGWSWPEPHTFVRAADDFRDLIASYQHKSSSKQRRWRSSNSSDYSGSLSGSVAELNLDEDAESNTKEQICTEVLPTECSPGKIDVTAGSPDRSDPLNRANQGQKTLSVNTPMEVLMPAHSESISSPVMNGVDQVADLNGNKMEHFKDLFRRRKPQSPGQQNTAVITPDDWLKYTSWARESIDSRAQACTRWRLVFDAALPTAAQISSFELSWKKAVMEEQVEDTYGDEISPNMCEKLRLRSNPDATVSHSRFKCFVNHNPVMANEKETEGERKAQALHSAVAKLDIDVELDLEEMEDSTNLNHDTHKSMYLKPNLNGTKYCEQNKIDLSSVTDSAFHSFPSDAVDSPPHSKEIGLAEQNGLAASYCEDADSTDSGCLITESKSIQEKHLRIGSMPISLSDCNIPSPRQPDLDFSNTKMEVKSWYCLNYIDLDKSDATEYEIADCTAHPKPTCAQDELHDVDLSQRCSPAQDKTFDINRTDVQALLHASRHDDLEQFIDCLEEVDCTAIDSAETERNGSSTDLKHYAQYFDNLLTNGDHDKTQVKINTSSAFEIRETANFGCDQYLDSQDTCVKSHLNSKPQPSTLQSNGSSHTTQGSCTEIDSPTIDPSAPQQYTQRNAASKQSSHNMARSDSLIDAGLSPSSTHLTGPNGYKPTAERQTSIDDSTNTEPESVTQPDRKPSNSIKIPNLGSFLTTILARLESLPHNCFYANLYLTSILSSLASYPQPLLRAIMLCVSPLPTSDYEPGSNTSGKLDAGSWRALQEAYSQLPHTLLCSVRRQLDVFSIQYTMCPPEGMNLSFMSLVIDAKEYFRYAKDSTCLTTNKAIAANGASVVADIMSKESRKPVPFLRRLFTRSKKWERAGKGLQRKNQQQKQSVDDSKPNRVSPHAYHQSNKAKAASGQFTVYKWLPEVGIPSPSEMKESKRKRSKRQSAKTRRLNSFHGEVGSKDRMDWPAVQRMVLCAVIFEEFCKELAALCIEHSVRS